jgi:hypothetical protein
VEQVALNRHVSPQQAAALLMTGKVPIVNTVSKAQHSMTTICRLLASNGERKIKSANLQSDPGHKASVFSGALFALENLCKYAVLYLKAIGFHAVRGPTAERIQEQQKWVNQ